MRQLNIHLTAIAYGLADDIRYLFEATRKSKHHVFWHLFLHSNFNDVKASCEWIASWPNVRYYDFGFNRGLSRSWNDGIINGYNGKADVCVIANDDMLPTEGDLDKLAEYAVEHREFYSVACNGYHVTKKKQIDTHYGFTAINPIAIRTIGMFDENYFPLYGEDADYIWRAHLAGLERGVVENTYVAHRGSTSIHNVKGLMAQNRITYNRNAEYHQRKWGGHFYQERFSHPFNDENIDLRIDPAPEIRHAPYNKHNRTDHHIVKM